jgi:hypothetical protein
MATNLDGDVTIRGSLIVTGQMGIPAGSVGNNQVSVGANLDDAKIMQRHVLRHSQKAGTAVVAESHILHIARAAGTIQSIEVVPDTPPAGGDLAFTVDLQKGNQSTAFASVLTGVITINSGVAARQVVAGAIVDDDYADNDSLRLVIAVTGSTGTQGQGFVVVVTLRENP